MTLEEFILNRIKEYYDQADEWRYQGFAATICSEAAGELEGLLDDWRESLDD